MPTKPAGRYFLQVPGPTVVPDEAMAAMSMPMLDHRSQQFADLARGISADLKKIFKTQQPVLIYPSSGTGAWEAAATNTLSVGDSVLIPEVGMFSTLWGKNARGLGLNVIEIPGDWRTGIDPAKVEDQLRADREGRIKAVFATHNETSTGVTSDIAAIRQAIDAAGHDALLFVDTISSLCATDFRMDEWGVDLAICGSQKGLMMPPGLSFLAVSEKARQRAESSNMAKGYFDWTPMFEAAETGFYPYTPPVSLFNGLRVTVNMLLEEGLENVFARHARLARATRAAVRSWGLEIQSIKESEHSAAVTAVRVPDGYSADKFRALVLEKYDMSLAAGLGKIADKVFRIGHLGYQNDLTVLGALAGVEMALGLSDIPHNKGGINAAMAILGT